MLSNINVYFRMILSLICVPEKKKHANMKIHRSTSLVTTKILLCNQRNVCFRLFVSESFRCYRSCPCSWGSSWVAAENPKISVANVSMLISGGSTLSNRDSVWDRHSSQDWYILKFTLNLFSQTFLDLKKVMFIQCRWYSMTSTKTSYTIMHIYVNTQNPKPTCNQVLFPGACFIKHVYQIRQVYFS